MEGNLRRDNDLAHGQMRVLELVARAAPLDETLSELVCLIEAQQEGLTCGIMIVSDDGRHFRRGVGPNLPEAYHEALVGARIAPPYPGPCGEAAHRSVSVSVPDIANDDRWAEEWRRLALSCGLAACLSMPVLGSEGRALASFALYYDRPGDPQPRNPEVVGIATHLAAIALERDSVSKRMQETQRRLAADLSATRQLQEISSLLIQEESPEALYDRIIDAAMALMESEAASMQMLEGQRGQLQLLAWKGFHPDSAAFWEWVSPDSPSVCGASMSSGRRLVVPDVEACDFITDSDDLDAFRRSGIRAVQSTPLVSRSGHLLGMLSTHWREPKNLKEVDLRLMDVLARQAADLIERAQAEAAVQRSEERFRSLFASAPVAVFVCDRDGVIQAYNERAAELWGRAPGRGDPNEVNCGSLMLRLPDGQVLPHAESPIVEVLRTGEPRTDVEVVVERPDGTQVPVLVNFAPLRDEAGEITGAVTSLVDIAERKRAEAVVRRRAEQLQALATAGLAVTGAATLDEKLDALTHAAADTVGAHQAVASVTRGADWSHAINAIVLSDKYAAWRDYDAVPDGSGIYALVCETNEPMRMTQAELEAHPRWRAFGPEGDEHPPMRGWLAAPLIASDGRNLGLIQLSDKLDGTEFDEADQAILVQIAQLASGVVEQATAEQALRESQARYAFLLALGDRLRSLSDPGAVMSAATEELGRHLGLGRARYLEIDEEAESVTAVVEWVNEDMDVEPIPEPLSLGVIGPTLVREAKQGRVLRFDDIRTDERTAHLADIFAEHGVVAALAVPLFRDGRLRAGLSAHVPEPRAWTDAEVALIRDAAGRTWAAVGRARVEQALRESEERLRQIIDGATEYAIFATDSERRVTSWNSGAQRLLGYTETEILGRSADIFFTAEDRAADAPAREMRQARLYGSAANERWHVRKDGSLFWGSGTMTPIGDGKAGTFLKIFRDRTQDRLAEERQRLLIGELNHRVKNTLATVQAIAAQTFRAGRAETASRHDFEARLRALAEGHDLLTQEHWEGADLRDVVETAMQPFEVHGGDRMHIDGPGLYLPPKAALAFAMALHELATNATKYGALSNRTGRVDITWTVGEGEDGRFRLVWAESGGPPVEEPEHRGFGTRLIERTLAGDLGADARIDYDPAGITCTIEAPVAELGRGGRGLPD